MANPNIAETSTVLAQRSVQKSVPTSPVTLLENAANSNQVLKINSISISNTDPLQHDITIQLVRNSVAYRILSTVKVPADSTLVAVSKGIGFYMLEGDILQAFASATDKLDAVCSYEQFTGSDIEYPTTDDFASSVVLLITANGVDAAQNNTFVDGSTNNFTMTRTGTTATQGSSSPYGTLWSTAFNGSTDFFTCQGSAAHAFGTGDFTIEAWAYPESFSTLNRTIIAAGTAASANNWQLNFGSSNVVTFFYRGSSTSTDVLNSTTVISTPQWVHIAVTGTGGVLRMFVNGQLESSVSYSWNYTDTSLRLGINRGSNAYFSGYLSNVRTVKGTALYTSNFTPSTTPLTAITNTSLLTCQSNRFIDNSSNNFAITVSGTPSVQRFSPFDPAEIYSPSLTGGSGYFSPTSYIVPNSNQVVDFGTGNFTVEMWMYAAAGNYNFFDGRSTSGQNAITLFLNSDSTVAFLNNNGTVRISGLGFQFGAWNHIAVTRTGTSTRLFLNGTQLGSTFTDSSTYISGTNRPAIGAAGFSAGASPLTGYISNLRVVKGTAVYTANFTPPTSPVTAIAGTSLLLNFTNAGIVDQSGENNPQTFGNVQLSTAVKKYGTASLAFDGTGDFLSMPDSPDLNFRTGDFTIEMWINFNSGAGSTFPRVITKGAYQVSSVVWGILMTRSTGLISFNTGNPDVSTTIGNLVNGVWTHIAVTRSGTTLRTFFNGVLNQTVTNTVNYVSTFDLRVGSDPADGGNFAGYIDDLRITKGVARYTANFTPPTSELQLV
jgi:hypothetical protein